jgi:hypothetical protein
LETVEGKVFQGPFVFRLEDGVEKLSRMGWLTETKPGKVRGKLKLVEAPCFPREVLWHPKFDDEDGGQHDKRVRQAEWAWRRAMEEEEVKEDWKCSICKSKGFEPSVTGEGCTFCDGTEGGNPPERKEERDEITKI